MKKTVECPHCGCKVNGPVVWCAQQPPDPEPERCTDCGEVGEQRGHMTCRYPGDDGSSEDAYWRSVTTHLEGPSYDTYDGEW